MAGGSRPTRSRLGPKIQGCSGPATCGSAQPHHPSTSRPMRRRPPRPLRGRCLPQGFDLTSIGPPDAGRAATRFTTSHDRARSTGERSGSRATGYAHGAFETPAERNKGYIEYELPYAPEVAIAQIDPLSPGALRGDPASATCILPGDQGRRGRCRPSSRSTTPGRGLPERDREHAIPGVNHDYIRDVKAARALSARAPSLHRLPEIPLRPRSAPRWSGGQLTTASCGSVLTFC